LVQAALRHEGVITLLVFIGHCPQNLQFRIGAIVAVAVGAMALGCHMWEQLLIEEEQNIVILHQKVNNSSFIRALKMYKFNILIRRSGLQRLLRLKRKPAYFLKILSFLYILLNLINTFQKELLKFILAGNSITSEGPQVPILFPFRLQLALGQILLHF
jgi:hypothetical protein